METERKKQELRHLGFMRIAAIKALVCVSSLYDYAKRNSGPLRSPVGTVESAVTAVVGPVYQKFKGVPDDLLVFLDKKVLFVCFLFYSPQINYFFLFSFFIFIILRFRIIFSK